MTLPALAVFDLAGTTVEDRGQVPDAFVAALASHGLHVTSTRLEALRGSSKRVALAELVPPGPDHERRTAAVHADFQRELAARYESTGVREIAGATATFAWLRARGVRIALNTGFDRETTERLLARLGWLTDTADAIVCADDVPRGRPAPDLILRAMERTDTPRADQVANVGDTALDLQAAHHAGVRWNIGVLSGAHGRGLLERAPHTHLIESVALLPRVFEP
jgi:phosphonatase-like hydrolase